MNFFVSYTSSNLLLSICNVPVHLVKNSLLSENYVHVKYSRCILDVVKKKLWMSNSNEIRSFTQ